MARNHLLIALLTIILGLSAGWFLWSWWNGAAVPPALPPVGTEATATKPKSRAGYCCVATGAACESVTDPGVCFRAGGKAFNAVQRNCDYYCLNVQP